MSRVKPQKNAIAHIPVRRDVPEGWSLSTVGECFFDIRNGTTASQNKQKRGVPVSRIETIQDGRFDLDRLRHIEKASAELLNVFAYKTGDIALSHINSFEHVGKTAIYEGKPKSLIHGMNLLRLRLGHEHLFTKYLYLFMQTDYFRWQVRDRVLHAVNQVSINQRSLSQVSVLLAPTREQKRIVAKVEQLLARINAARERLAKVPAILKRFRQSVLAAACSGRLTADWRDRHGEVDSVDEILKRLEKRRVDEATTPKQKNRLKEIYSYREKEDPRLIPENWTYVALDKLCGSFQYGTSRKSQSSGKVPVLRMGNIQDGHIDWNNLVYTSDDSEIQKYRLNSGSVLFNRTNSPELVGKTGIYRGEQPAVFAGYLIRINNFDDLNSEYLNYCLNSNHAKEFCLRVKTDGVSQSNINAQKLGKFEVPFCSLEEQQEIVRRLGALFRFADQIEARYQKAKAHTEKLTQAILSKAFRGDLVATEAELARREGQSYKPASVLLERIKAEREAIEKEKRPKKQKLSRRRRHRTPAKETATETKFAVSVDTFEGAKRIPTDSDSTSHGPAASQVSNKRTPLTKGEASITSKKRGRETSLRPVALSDLETGEVMAVFRKACRGHGAMSREELLKEVSLLLGYQRVASAIQERLKGHLRAAIRRKIIVSNGHEVWLDTKSMDDYERADLVSLLGSVMRWDKEYDREEVIRALANYLGFRRLTDGVRAPIKSAINSAIRQGDIVGSISTIRRIL